MAHSIIVNGPLKYVCGCKIIPFSGYFAITLFGKVYTRKSAEYMENYLQTERGKQTDRHETWHVLQAKSLSKDGSNPKWIKFYLLYLWYWAKYFFTHFNNRVAYKTIPFEAEAYARQKDYSNDISEWKKWKMTNKERKKYFKDMGWR